MCAEKGCGVVCRRLREVGYEGRTLAWLLVTYRLRAGERGKGR